MTYGLPRPQLSSHLPCTRLPASAELRGVWRGRDPSPSRPPSTAGVPVKQHTCQLQTAPPPEGGGGEARESDKHPSPFHPGL